MTHRQDVARGRDIVARWCALAEARLEHLTELFESGRWRRYHSELAFLQNIQEAKSAVEIWRDLSLREASRDNSALDMSWLGRGRATLPPSQMSRHQVHALRPQPAAIADEPSRSNVTAEATSAPVVDDAMELTPDVVAITERYPLLRNAL
jgi:uncharacterized repeat protein (TIGR03809 family)